MTPRADFTEISELLRYEPDTGRLFWMNRPRLKCADERSWKIWNTKHEGKEAFTGRTSSGYLSGRIFNKTYLAHRVCWLLATGDWPVEDIDHINGDRSDNRFVNLRSVSRTGNNRNRRRSSNNTSGVTGVSWHFASSSWHATIGVGKKQVSLGYYKTVEAAEVARISANIKHGFSARHGGDA